MCLFFFCLTTEARLLLLAFAAETFALGLGGEPLLLLGLVPDAGLLLLGLTAHPFAFGLRRPAPGVFGLGRHPLLLVGVAASLVFHFVGRTLAGILGVCGFEGACRLGFDDRRLIQRPAGGRLRLLLHFGRAREITAHFFREHRRIA